MRYVVPDKKCSKDLWLKNYSLDGVLYRSKAYKLWSEMKFRCNNKKFQEKYPTYKGCELSSNFQDYQYFAEWCQSQIGYNFDSYELDKDLLSGKLYSEDTCVFIPKSLNSFLASKPLGGKGNPKGVYPRKTKAGIKYVVSISIDCKSEYLGYFECPLKAKEAYNTAKINEVRRWYERTLIGEYLVDQRVTDKLEDWSPLL